MTRIIGIISGKGGVGKTTVVSNLGSILASKFDQKITIVDCNVTNSHLGLSFGMYYFPVTLNKVMRDSVDIEEAIYKHYSGVNIIPASLSVSDLKGVDIIKLKDAIQPLYEKNDIVILDGSPGLGRETMGMLRAANEILFVATPLSSSLIDIVRTKEVVDEIGLKITGIIINMRRGERYELKNREIEQFTGLKVISSIPFDKNVYRSSSFGSPVFLSHPKTSASKELYKTACLLIGKEYEETRLTKMLQRFGIKNFFKNVN